MWVSSTVNSLRISTIMLGFSNLAVVIVGGVLLFLVFPGCELNRITIPVAMVSLAAAFKIFAMFKSGIAQKATAFSILDSPLDSSAIDSINRLRRRVYAQLSPFKGKKKFLLQGLTIFLVIRILVCRAYFS